MHLICSMSQVQTHFVVIGTAVVISQTNAIPAEVPTEFACF
jgi:hypothetical protein